MSQVDAIINQALSIANQKSEEVSTLTNNAQTAAEGFATFGVVEDVPNPRAIEPDVFIPLKLDKTQTSIEFDRIFNLLVNLASSKIGEFLASYFPLATDGYDEATAWLIKAITKGGTGIPKDVEDQIWQRDRERVLLDNLRAQNSTIEDAAARGLPLPDGSIVSQVQEQRMKGLGEIASASRDVAIKQVEIEIANVRFAVEQALKLRVAAVNAAVDYIRALMQGAEVASRHAFQILDMQATLINAVSNFYRARLERDSLSIQAATSRGTLQVEQANLAVRAFQASIDAKVTAAVGGAESAGRVGAAAMSAINAIASLQSTI